VCISTFAFPILQFSFDIIICLLIWGNANDTTFNAKFTANNLAVSVPFGALTAIASVGNGKIKVDGITEMNLNAAQLGLTYALSKRTTAYSYFGQTKFKDLTVTPNETLKFTTTAFGVRHTF
jgi:predicted porin